MRTISEKVQEQPEYNSEKEKRIEFSVPTWQVLNGLEVMGYKVVTCGDYMTGEQRHDQKEFVWTLYKNKEDWETSTKGTQTDGTNIINDSLVLSDLQMRGHLYRVIAISVNSWIKGSSPVLNATFLCHKK